MCGLELGYFAHYEVGHNASSAFVRDFWGDIAVKSVKAL
jgi:hypothetical protein